MKKFLFTVALICIFNFGALAQEPKPTLQSLAFIAGCWEISKPEKKMMVSEQWMTADGGAMIGMSRTVRGGKMTGFEFLRVVEDGTGIHYISKPSENKEETAFKLVKWAAGDVTFENPTHDFPQRIIYRLTKPDALSARIEGTMNGKASGIDFLMTRAKCP